MNKNMYIEEFLKYITNYDSEYLIGIDFDGTLAENLFPISSKPGPPIYVDIVDWIFDFYFINQKDFDDSAYKILKKNFTTKISVPEIIRHWKDNGDQFILWTCRTSELYQHKDALADAVSWCEFQGIEFIAVNENHPGIAYNPRKLLVDRVIDDNAGNVTHWKLWNQNQWYPGKKGKTLLEILADGEFDINRPKD